MSERIDTLVVGGGQAGLATSYWLDRAGRDHLVLEKDRLAERWRSDRWDSFTLVTPNWTLQLPGFPYAAFRPEADPDAFLERGEVVRYLEAPRRSPRAEFWWSEADSRAARSPTNSTEAGVTSTWRPAARCGCRAATAAAT